MISGRLDTPITIQALTTATDSMGATTESWATASGAPTFAQYIPLKGDEVIEMGKITSNTVFKLRIRRWADLTSKHRVQVGGDNAKIISIEDGRRKGYMILWCEVTE